MELGNLSYFERPVGIGTIGALNAETWSKYIRDKDYLYIVSFNDRLNDELIPQAQGTMEWSVAGGVASAIILTAIMGAASNFEPMTAVDGIKLAISSTLIASASAMAKYARNQHHNHNTKIRYKRELKQLLKRRPDLEGVNAKYNPQYAKYELVPLTGGLEIM